MVFVEVSSRKVANVCPPRSCQLKSRNNTATEVVTAIGHLASNCALLAAAATAEEIAIAAASGSTGAPLETLLLVAITAA